MQETREVFFADKARLSNCPQTINQKMRKKKIESEKLGVISKWVE
jgi:hypothetical protein